MLNLQRLSHRDKDTLAMLLPVQRLANKNAYSRLDSKEHLPLEIYGTLYVVFLYATVYKYGHVVPYNF